jgi:hypothetical protein
MMLDVPLSTALLYLGAALALLLMIAAAFGWIVGPLAWAVLMVIISARGISEHRQRRGPSRDA